MSPLDRKLFAYIYQNIRGGATKAEVRTGFRKLGIPERVLDMAVSCERRSECRLISR
jgi:hypothetical protein